MCACVRAPWAPIIINANVKAPSEEFWWSKGFISRRRVVKLAHITYCDTSSIQGFSKPSTYYLDCQGWCKQLFLHCSEGWIINAGVNSVDGFDPPNLCSDNDPDASPTISRRVVCASHALMPMHIHTYSKVGTDSTAATSSTTRTHVIVCSSLHMNFDAAVLYKHKPACTTDGNPQDSSVAGMSDVLSSHRSSVHL